MGRGRPDGRFNPRAESADSPGRGIGDLIGYSDRFALPRNGPLIPICIEEEGPAAAIELVSADESSILFADRSQGRAVTGAWVPARHRRPALVIPTSAVRDVAEGSRGLGVGVDEGLFNGGRGAEMTCMIDDPGPEGRDR